MAKELTPARQIEGLTKRLEKAQGLIEQVQPVRGLDDHHIVQADGGAYLVNGKCTCADWKYRQKWHKGWCKHRLAVSLYEDAA